MFLTPKFNIERNRGFLKYIYEAQALPYLHKAMLCIGHRKALLPPNLIHAIPCSTASYWRNEDNKTYVGEEFSDLVFKEREDLKIMCDHRVRRVKKGFILISFYQLT